MAKKSGFWNFMKALAESEISWDKPKPSKIIIYKDDYVCKKCSYGWTTKKSFGSPAFCPRCKSNSIMSVDRG